MAYTPITAGPSVDEPTFAEPVSATRRRARKEVPLFHFGLRHVLGVVAVLSLLMTGLVSADGVTALVVLLAVCVVALHLLATALGSRLRADADRIAGRRSDGAGDARRGALRSHADAIASSAWSHRSPWHGRGSTALPWLPRLILAGATFGGVIGLVFLALSIGHRASVAGIVVGSLSAAVLGAWLSFLGGSFYGVFRHGVRDALAEQRKDEAP